MQNVYIDGMRNISIILSFLHQLSMCARCTFEVKIAIKLQLNIYRVNFEKLEKNPVEF